MQTADYEPSSQAIILTHSNSTSSQSARSALKKKVQRVMLVEVGGRVEKADLLVSSPAEDNLFTLDTFADLEKIRTQVVENQCKIDLWPDQCYFNDGKGYCDATGVQIE